MFVIISVSDHICNYNLVSTNDPIKDMKTVASFFRGLCMERSIERGEIYGSDDICDFGVVSTNESRKVMKNIVSSLYRSRDTVKVLCV